MYSLTCYVYGHIGVLWHGKSRTDEAEISVALISHNPHELYSGIDAANPAILCCLLYDVLQIKPYILGGGSVGHVAAVLIATVCGRQENITNVDRGGGNSSP